MRPDCLICDGSMEGRKAHAVYCSRRCKTRASDQRRVKDGREQQRSVARYPAEAEKRKADVAVYQAANRERMREIRLRRRGRIKNTSYIVTEQDWRRLCVRWGNRCAYCGEDRLLTRDHVVALARGGTHGIGNLLPACGPCNSAKKTKTIMEWRVQRARGGRREVIPHLTPSA